MFKNKKKLILIPVMASVLALSACAADSSDLDEFAAQLLETATEETSEDEVPDDEVFEDTEKADFGDEDRPERPEGSPDDMPENLIDDLMKREPEGGRPGNLIDDLMEGMPEGEMPDKGNGGPAAPSPDGERPEAPDFDKEDVPSFDGERPEGMEMPGGMKPGAREGGKDSDRQFFGRMPQMPSEDTIRGILEDMEISEEDIEKILAKMSEMEDEFAAGSAK